MWGGLHDAGIVAGGRVGNPCQIIEGLEGFDSPPLPLNYGETK